MGAHGRACWRRRAWLWTRGCGQSKRRQWVSRAAWRRGQQAGKLAMGDNMGMAHSLPVLGCLSGTAAPPPAASWPWPLSFPSLGRWAGPLSFFSGWRLRSPRLYRARVCFSDFLLADDNCEAGYCVALLGLFDIYGACLVWSLWSAYDDASWVGRVDLGGRVLDGAAGEIAEGWLGGESS